MTKAARSLQAKDVMTHPPICVRASDTIRQLARVFSQNEISGAPVVDDSGRLVGIVAKTDLIRRCADGIVEVPLSWMYGLVSEQKGKELDLVPEPLICVGDFMTANPVTVSPETAVQNVARLMTDRRIHRVVVTDTNSRPIGIITSMDMVGALTRDG